MQGFNMGRYIPPDAPTGSGNKTHRVRAPGTLRRDGTQTVRFELPFAVWCASCSGLIGQGVRFNAVKARVGAYYSTPIWSFGITHAACGGRLEIRTDPKNTAYVVAAGGRARDYGDDAVRDGDGEAHPVLTDEERARRREDAFARLEAQNEDKAQQDAATLRTRELYASAERDWADPWAANKRLRTAQRMERRARKRAEGEDEALKDRLGTDIEMLPATEEDAVRAGLVSFGEEPDQPQADGRAASKPLFRNPSRSSTGSSRLSKSAKDSRKEALRRQLVSNTRATLNPFG